MVQRIEDGDITLSFSSLRSFASSPKDFMAYKLKKHEQTDAMLLGEVLHTIVLQPQEFDKKFFVINDTEIMTQIGGLKPRGTKAYKEWKQQELDKNAGKVCIDSDIYLQAFDMRNALYENQISQRYLNRITSKEFEIKWNFMDRDFRGFIDGANLVEDGCLIMDLKKVVDAHPRKVERVIIEELYYMQLAMYKMGLKQNFDFDLELSKCFVVSVDAKCHVSVNKIHPDLLKYGEQKLVYLLKKFNECTFKNKWHEDYEFYSEYGGIFLVDRPAYTYK